MSVTKGGGRANADITNKNSFQGTKKKFFYKLIPNSFGLEGMELLIKKMSSNNYWESKQDPN